MEAAHPRNPTPSSSSMSPNSNQNKGHRVLACVLCQHRKIKCDRNTPCSNCLKANVTCTPSTPAPARKRRRPNQDLQERLARCEQLLKQYASGSATPSTAEAAAQISAANPPPPPAPRRAASQQLSLPHLNPQETQAAAPLQRQAPAQSMPALSSLATAATAPAAPTAPTVPADWKPASADWKPAGKIVVEDGSVRFMDSYLWASIHDQLQAMREIVESDDMEDQQSVFASEAVTPDDNMDLLLNDIAAIDLEDVQPEPIQVFRLWQIFLERVNPFTKLIHVPSLQPSIVEAAANHSRLPNNVQALLFSIYTVAVVAMTDAESRQMLDMSREEALKQFTAGIKAALTKVNFLKNYDMVTLQALVLYLIGLQGRYNRHAAWVLSGVLIRIAQKMGLHRDGDLLGLNPFETEMRRRLWWQIIMLDSKYAMTSGFSETLLPLSWNTKLPQNVNDADIFPGSTEPIQPREGPTEMAFCLILYEIGNFVSKHHGLPDFEAIVLGNEENKKGREEQMAVFKSLIDVLEARLIDQENRYCDPSVGGIHIVAVTIRPMVISKIRGMMVPMREQPEWGTEIQNAQDNIFKIALTNNEHNIMSYPVMEELGFIWFFKLHFQVEIFAVMIGQLYKKPTGKLADRAWKMIDQVYHYHDELNDMSQRQHSALAMFVLRAWRARERTFLDLGISYETPTCIPKLQALLPQHSSSESSSSVGPSPVQPVKADLAMGQSDAMMDQILGGFLDASALDWDMWADFGAQGAGPQTTAAALGGFGSFTPQSNW